MNEQIEALFPFYAMEAVSEKERQQVEAYIATNPDAATRLQTFIESAALLPLSTAATMPSPSVKQGLLDRIQADPRAIKQSLPAVKTAVSLPQPGFWDQLRTLSGKFRPTPTLAGFAALVAILAIAWSLLLNQQRAALEAELALQRELLTIYTSPAAETIAIDSTDVEREAVGRLTLDRASNRAVLNVANLADVPEKVYQLWFIQGDIPISAGVFDVDATGHEIYLVETAVPTTFDAIGVSIEPPGGSDRPTGDIVLLGNWEIGD
ncbi:MAG: anti-sigma factor domain-containing protein [Anaerolineae bacterium]